MGGQAKTHLSCFKISKPRFGGRRRLMEGGEGRKIALEVFCRLCAKSVREGHRKTKRVMK